MVVTSPPTETTRRRVLSTRARWTRRIFFTGVVTMSLLVSRFARCNVSFITNQTTLDASVVTKHHHHRSILVDSNLIRRAALVHVTRSDHPRRKKLRATETRFVSRILFFFLSFFIVVVHPSSSRVLVFITESINAHRRLEPSRFYQSERRPANATRESGLARSRSFISRAMDAQKNITRRTDWR